MNVIITKDYTKFKYIQLERIYMHMKIEKHKK